MQPQRQAKNGSFPEPATGSHFGASRLSRLIPTQLLLLACLSVPGSGQATTTLDDAVIQEAMTSGCNRSHDLENYRGHLRRFDTVGPLWLAKPGKSRLRGFILPPYLRVYWYGRSHRCKDLELSQARELAGPEVWVVLFRIEDPPSPPGSKRTRHDQKVSRPSSVTYRNSDGRHEPLWERTRDSRAASWFYQHWIERESLVVAFEELSRDGQLYVDYTIEHEGSSYLTELEVFTLRLLPEDWWYASFRR